MDPKIPIDLVIPPRPMLIDVLMRERNKEEPDFHTIEKTIASDIGVSGALIKVANSPLIGARNKITNIRSAMQTIGMRQVVSISCGMVLRHLLKGGDAATMERFWDTTDHVSSLCGLLARRFKVREPDEAVSYGLFHDCGIPVLMLRYPSYKDVLRSANARQDKSFVDIEDEILNTNHSLVGCFLTKNWGLSPALSSAILNHHDLDYFINSAGMDNGITRTLIALGHFAEHLHHVSKRGSDDTEWTKFGEPVLQHFGLSREDYEDLLAESEELSMA